MVLKSLLMVMVLLVVRVKFLEVLKDFPEVSHVILSMRSICLPASELARQEFPAELTVEKRSAISIARRLQDPLTELVKIDPKSIGVGQYR